MIRSALVALFGLLMLVASCGPKPAPPWVPPTDQGGAPAAGGASTGGSVPLEPTAGASGQVATGGAPFIGGDLNEIQCNPDTKKAAPVVRHKLGRRHGAIVRRPRTAYVVVDGLPDPFWTPLAAALDQGDLGSCTTNAGLDARLSLPFTWNGTLDPGELQRIARDLYSGSTARDPFPGQWPPDDTGSNGASALDEMIDAGYFAGYSSPQTFEDVQTRLQRGPCIVGMDWYDGFFAPDRCGQVKKTGTIAGGHELELSGMQYPTKRVLLRNSWDGWGVSWRGKWGFFWMTFGDFVSLLNAGGDVQCPIVSPSNDNAQPYREAS